MTTNEQFQVLLNHMSAFNDITDEDVEAFITLHQARQHLNALSQASREKIRLVILIDRMDPKEVHHLRALQYRRGRLTFFHDINNLLTFHALLTGREIIPRKSQSVLGAEG